jgi:hypothetical protein
MDTPNGALVRRCFRILNAESIGLTITLTDITEEEFRVLKLIEAERQELRWTPSVGQNLACP